MNMNPLMFFQLMKNPQQALPILMQANPQMAQMLQGINPNDSKSMEQLCRNVCQQKGIDFDTMLTQFKQSSSRYK